MNDDIADQPPTPFTVRDAMVLCGLDDNNPYQGETAAQRFASGLFDDAFETCMDKTLEELAEDLKSFSDLPANAGRIRLAPNVKGRIKAFVQWVCHEMRLGREPANSQFPVGNTVGLMKRYQAHKHWKSQAPTMADTAKPTKFKENTKWEDWYPMFRNFLRSQPGRNGVPLSYVIRTTDLPDTKPHVDFLDDYVAMAPLDGAAFVQDAQVVHTHIVNLIAGNTMAEAKIQAITDQQNGRLDFVALRNHYEGVGVHARDVQHAENDLAKLFYAGERKPNMWWDEFEKRLTRAFVVIDKKENRTVYSNDMKLRKLMEKIHADFLSGIKSSINVELAKIPMTMTYETALNAFRNAVTQKFPPELGGRQRVSRNIQEVNRSKSKYKGNKHYRGDEKITLTDGTKINYHPSNYYPGDVLRKMKATDKKRLRDERTAYRNRNSGSGNPNNDHRVASEVQRTAQERAQVQIQEILTRHNIPDDAQTQISAVTQNTFTTMMGGRNEQAARRSANTPP